MLTTTLVNIDLDLARRPYVSYSSSQLNITRQRIPIIFIVQIRVHCACSELRSRVRG